MVRVYTAGQDHGLVYIAMELVDKGSLDDLLNLQGRVAEAQVLEVGVQTAKGLNAALQRGLIHRDDGLPAGSGLDFADELTLTRALEGRREMT